MDNVRDGGETTSVMRQIRPSSDITRRTCVNEEVDEISEKTKYYDTNYNNNNNNNNNIGKRLEGTTVYF